MRFDALKVSRAIVRTACDPSQVPEGVEAGQTFPVVPPDDQSLAVTAENIGGDLVVNTGVDGCG